MFNIADAKKIIEMGNDALKQIEKTLKQIAERLELHQEVLEALDSNYKEGHAELIKRVDALEKLLKEKDHIKGK